MISCDLHPGTPCYDEIDGPTSQMFVPIAAPHWHRRLYVRKSIADYYARHNWTIDPVMQGYLLYDHDDLTQLGYAPDALGGYQHGEPVPDPHPPTPPAERTQRRMLPLLEAKMMHHYDTRWATYGGAP